MFDRGWTPAGELLPSDRVMGLDHGWINVDAVATTEHLSKVYNLRVEIDHTYFVGALDWNFAVWVHNDYSFGPFFNKTADVFEVLKDAAGNVVKTKVGTLTELDVNGVKKYVYKSEVNKDANGNFYEEVFDTPKQALAKFEAEAAKASAGSATAGAKNGAKVDGGAPGKILKEGMDDGNAGTAGRAAPTGGVSRVWPKHHPFPKYLGGAADQTLKKIPRNLHYQFHASLDKWMGGKYARAHTAAAFKDLDKAEVIKDLTNFYKTADGGAYAKYLDDFLQAVKESGF